MLEGLPVREGPSRAFIIDGLNPQQLLEAWDAARAALPRTGRWPVAFSGEADDIPERSEPELAVFAEVVQRTDPWSVFKFNHFEGPLEAHQLSASLPEPNLAEEATRALTLPVTCSDLDRWTYDRVRHDQAIYDRLEDDLQFYENGCNWYVPSHMELVLLPTASPWLPAAWLSYWGAKDGNDEGRVPLGAVLREWHEKWSAELVACWGTMLQFEVGRPPASGQQAWDLNRQIMIMAGSLQDPHWMRALALERTNTWFLHDRP